MTLLLLSSYWNSGAIVYPHVLASACRTYVVPAFSNTYDVSTPDNTYVVPAPNLTYDAKCEE